MMRRLGPGFHFDRSVVQVEDPARQSELPGRSLVGPAEPHALHVAREEEAIADRRSAVLGERPLKLLDNAELEGLRWLLGAALPEGPPARSASLPPCPA